MIKCAELRPHSEEVVNKLNALIESGNIIFHSATLISDPDPKEAEWTLLENHSIALIEIIERYSNENRKVIAEIRRFVRFQDSIELRCVEHGETYYIFSGGAIRDPKGCLCDFDLFMNAYYFFNNE